MKDATFSSSRLLSLYDRISDAPDAIPRLRRFVLDLAVRGKLVEQDLTDEPTAELLKRIANEKARLVKAGEIKRQVAQSPISKDDMPFSLPTGWAWARLGEIGLVGSSSRVVQNDWQSRGVPFYRAREIVELSKNGIIDNELFISKKRFQELSNKGNIPEAGDIMITGVGTIGVPYVVLRDDRFYFKDASVLIFKNIFNVNPSFMFLIMKSPYWVENVHTGSMGTTVHTLTINRAQSICLPIPPVAEQQRIVAKVDELMALCDQLEQARAEREAVRDRLTAASLARLTAPDTDVENFESHARFVMQTLPILTSRPDQIKKLRQTILNLAVRGKLVAQDAREGTGEKLLHVLKKSRVSDKRGGSARREIEAGEIFPEEEYLGIPASWAWMRVAEAGTTQTGTSPSSAFPELFGNFVPFIKPGDLNGNQINYSGPGLSEAGMAKSRVAPERTVLMVCIGATLGKVNVTDRTVCFNQQINSVTPYPDLNHMFVALALKSQGFQDLAWSKAGTGTLPIISKGKWEVLPIPLPPLAEQHRIVAKVDNLMALCDQLEANLTTATTTRAGLLEALLADALNPASMHEMEAAE